MIARLVKLNFVLISPLHRLESDERFSQYGDIESLSFNGMNNTFVLRFRDVQKCQREL